MVIVTAPEEMPVSETLELIERLGDETDIDLAAVVVNRVLPELFGRGEEEMFDRLREPAALAALEPRRSAATSARCSTAPSWPSRLRRTRAAHLDRLRDEPARRPAR